MDDGVILATVGNAFTDTDVEVEGKLVHPVPGYVTLSVYTPLSDVVVVVNDVLSADVVVLKLFGPVQLYDAKTPVPVTEPAVNVNAVPTHKLAGDGVMLATVGRVFTVTDADVTAELEHPVPG